MSLISRTENKKLLLFFLTVKALFLIGLVFSGYVGLAPDEAQYWTWSKSLDFGYFSKPPGIAWQIFATTSLFGDTELGIRTGAIVIGFILPLVVYSLAIKLDFSSQIAFWSGIAMAFSPLGFYLSFAATTDAGAILFLTLGIWAIIKNEKPDYIAAGFFIFFGALFKWTAFILWPFVFLFACFSRRFRQTNLLWGVLISLCALLPVIYWNYFHEWATFRHVGKATLQTETGNFFEFLLAQIGLLSPVYFVYLVASFFFLFHRYNWKITFCVAFPLTVLIYLILAWFKKMQPNWAAYLYPAGMPLLAWVASISRKWKIGFYVGTGFSIFLILAAFSVPWIQSHTKWSLPYAANPFRQSMGWSQLPVILNGIGYDPKTEFLFGDKYQAASLLSFYSPGKKRAYFFNISHTRKNQFSYWSQMHEKEKGKAGYLVVLENTKEGTLEWYRTHYLRRLSPFFERVEYVGAFPLYIADEKPVKFAIIFKGIKYLGNAPIETKKY